MNTVVHHSIIQYYSYRIQHLPTTNSTSIVLSHFSYKQCTVPVVYHRQIRKLPLAGSPRLFSHLSHRALILRRLPEDPKRRGEICASSQILTRNGNPRRFLGERVGIYELTNSTFHSPLLSWFLFTLSTFFSIFQFFTFEEKFSWKAYHSNQHDQPTDRSVTREISQS
ncbi:hypothetical protein L873DRAFT_1490883 [Choiromyces venosus 120613-1]|uniref:Uncharacterized protein n=1 Tax=Choiromyces venosus 120613-1 TaxID=1336337 RepID=A0A3N4J739_9PEZI|nr:hypothetical protein L873DRAFT_1490883 [Choiromyces venosus 120613-1]